MVQKKLDIIWNMSLVCPWDCKICCVDAVHVTSRSDQFTIVANNLKDVGVFNRNSNDSIYNQATKIRQEERLELKFEQKIKVIDNLKDYKVKINFSGGDPLVVDENLEVMKYANTFFGKENIQISTTGAGLTKCDPVEIAKFIGKLKFSYDSSDGVYNPNRPIGYNNSNLKKAHMFSKEGIFTVAEIPLSIRNTNSENIELIYQNLNKGAINQALLMRLFPVGRGIGKATEIPSPSLYLNAIETFEELARKYGKPKLGLQCALKHLKGNNEENPCDLFRESFAITPDGLLLTSAWAYGLNGKPLDDAFVLGNISEQRIDDILISEKAKYYQEHLDDNFGHCKIFAFLNSVRRNLIDRVFDKTDPLYRDNPKLVETELNQSLFRILK
ncbi:hypothetical protein HY498_00015 [Candidatus Woesearchaeota archaeon]|nr:hypothetical protein [Candidatus Woesearchaeota archaeon]